MRYLELIKDQLPVRPVSLVVVGNFMKIFDASLLIYSVEAEETLLLPNRQCEIGAFERPRPELICRTQGRDLSGFAPSTGSIINGTRLFPNLSPIK